MNATALFVYGTLRHDQPEHAKYCRGVIGWRPARVRGRLFRIPEGYLVLVVPRESMLLRATDDARADEVRRATLAPIDGAATTEWIDGELLEFRDASVAWPPLDAWESFAPGRPGVYARCVVPVWLEDEGGAARMVPAWAYVANEPAYS